MQIKYTIAGLAGLLVCACSQNGAEAQSVASEKTSEFQPNWVVDSSQSRLKFAGSQGGEDFTGNFAKFDALIKFDVDDLENSQVVVSVDMTSADAGDAERNEALPGKEWFSTKAFPKAVFTANTFSKSGENEYEASGQLKIRDMTHDIVLPFNLVVENATAVMNGKTSINRTDFNVGTGMWAAEDWVAHQVDIEVNLTASKILNQ
jgi:polyisoprenoid-binding protein YceI